MKEVEEVCEKKVWNVETKHTEYVLGHPGKQYNGLQVILFTILGAAFLAFIYFGILKVIETHIH